MPLLLRRLPTYEKGMRNQSQISADLISCNEKTIETEKYLFPGDAVASDGP